MRIVMKLSALAAIGLIFVAGCADENGHGKPKTKVISIAAGPDSQKQAVEAFIKVKDGETIEFAEGTFEFDTSLRLEDVKNVTVRGQGMDKTILNFAKQQAGTGGEGIIANINGFKLEDIWIQDTKADAVKTQGVEGITFRNVRVEWTRGPNPDNGAYGLYPVLCSNVLIEGCFVSDCSDAGIYVGQSKNVIVRKCRAERNVAGIEIENTVGADVYENDCTNNTGGMLVFALPGTEMKQKEGRQCRVYNNKLYKNNHPNFAKEGNIVATVPPGSGLIIMANDEVEVFKNEIADNDTANISIICYLINQKKYDDPAYDPYCEGVYIHDNVLTGGGQNPGGDFAQLMSPLGLQKLPDIVWDGMVDQKKLVDGKLPKEMGIYFKNNGDADFVNLDIEKLLNNEQPNVSDDMSPHDGELPPLGEVKIPGVN
ncbi:MAG: right-handed parallel beta-helix repeat-containing protein [Planctomycetaceae bacterium]|nr:right-handed parallel beta-helix repeat-containing protein [Planctomycetaceae bacterium]